MNINNLKNYINENSCKIKNYKAICELLEEKCKTGGAKINQMEDWMCHFQYHKEGNSIVIDSFNEIIKVKEDKRVGRQTGTNKIEYIKNIERLVIDLLAQNPREDIFLPKRRLLKELHMINGNYGFCKERIPKLSKFLEIDEDIINEFYESSDSTLKGNLEKALDRLRSKSLIYWSKEMTIAIATAYDERIYEKESTDEYGEVSYTYKANSSVKTNHIQADDEQVKFVLACEKSTMKQLGCKDKVEIISQGLWNEFKIIVKSKTMEQNIIYYYDSYKILFNQDYILEACDEYEDLLLLKEERLLEQSILNLEVAKRLLKNAEKRQSRASKEYSDWIGELPVNKQTNRLDNNYMSDNLKLINKLITSDNDIKRDVKNTKLK